MPTEIDRYEVQRLQAEGAQIVEVLPAPEYEHSHIAGAISVPLSDIPEKAPERLDHDRPVVTYCWDSLCDMSPRAAWRLESIGFTDVYDYVASKTDWLGAGLPFEGTLAQEPRLATLAKPDVPTCSLDATLEEVRERIGDWELCLVVNDKRVVLGLVRAESLGMNDSSKITDVMREAPKTFRPHVSAEEFAPELDKSPRPWVLVTNLNGVLVGVARPEDIQAAAKEKS